MIPSAVSPEIVAFAFPFSKISIDSISMLSPRKSQYTSRSCFLTSSGSEVKSKHLEP